MKKISIIVLLLFVSLSTSGCVNKFAVQELNKKAQEYMKDGKTEDAISRLESSIDLDNSIFETYYNLAVAYMKADKSDKAEEALKKVFELKPDFADSYYTMAVIFEDKAYSLINGENKQEKETIDNEGKDISEKKELTAEERAEICSNFDSAVDYYNKYLVKKQNASDKDQVNEKINKLNLELQKYGKVEAEEN